MTNCDYWRISCTFPVFTSIKSVRIMIGDIWPCNNSPKISVAEFVDHPNNRLDYVVWQRHPKVSILDVNSSLSDKFY
jgi:hypothetical protein